jgi:MFS family permease
MFPVIYLASFLTAWVGNLVSISLSLFLAQVKQSSPLIIGLAGFIGNAAYTVTTFTLIRHPFRQKIPFFVLVPAASAIFYLLMPFSPVPVIFSFLLFIGIFLAFFWPAVQMCFARSDDELKIGIFNVSWSAGVILGTFSAGFIFALNPRTSFFIASFITLLSFILLFSNRNKLTSVRTDTEITGEKLTLNRETIFEIRLLNFLHFFATSSIFFLYPKLGLVRGFSPQFIGSVVGIMLISRFFTFFILMDKPIILHPARFIVSCLLFFISCCLAGLGRSPYVVVAGVMILGFAGAFSYHNSLLMHIKYRLRTEMHESILGAGTFSGALTAGILGQIFNLPVAYVIIGAGIFLVGIWHSRSYLSNAIKRQLIIS